MKDIKSLIESNKSSGEIVQEAAKSSSALNNLYNNSENLLKKNIGGLTYAISKGLEVSSSDLKDIKDNLKEALKILNKIK